MRAGGRRSDNGHSRARHTGRDADRSSIGISYKFARRFRHAHAGNRHIDGRRDKSERLKADGFPDEQLLLRRLGNNIDSAVNIHSLAIYDPVADADLPGLSA
jgi:hypothetical protein